MHTPTDAAQRAHLGAFWRKAVHVDGGHALFLDRARFETADPTTPWALFQGPLPSLVWLVRGDGLVGAAWDGYFDTTDKDTACRLADANPIGLLLAAHTGHGDTPTEGIFPLEAWRGPTAPTWTCLAANAAARALDAVHMDAATAGAVAAAFHTGWAVTMRDPFPDLAPHTPWTAEQADALGDVARDVLLALGLTTGVFGVGSATEHGQTVHVFEPHAWQTTLDVDRASKILRHLTDPAAFQGWEWEYNDGARDRASGYNAYSATICTIDLSTASAHTRLSAKAATLARLERAPDQGRAVLHLLDTTA